MVGQKVVFHFAAFPFSSADVGVRVGRGVVRGDCVGGGAADVLSQKCNPTLQLRPLHAFGIGWADVGEQRVDTANPLGAW